MFDTESLDKYYQGVPEAELRRFQDFLKTHPAKHIDWKGQRIPYLNCGQGEKNILLPPGGGGGIFPPEYGFRSILNFEKDHRVIAPGGAAAKTLDELSEVLNQILRAENVDKVIVVGGSGAGVFAQTYFKRNYSRVEAMVLYNTLAPRRERNKRWGLWMLRMLPARIIGAMAKKKLGTLFPGEVPPEAEARIALTRAVLNEVIGEKFEKDMLLSFVKLAFEFNESDGYTLEDFRNWKILIMTGAGDPGFKDTAI